MEQQQLHDSEEWTKMHRSYSSKEESTYRMPTVDFLIILAVQLVNETGCFLQTVDGFINRFNIDIRVKSEVTGIDLKNKSIRVHDIAANRDYAESYDKLIISTGAEPIKPPMPGI